MGSEKEARRLFKKRKKVSAAERLRSKARSAVHGYIGGTKDPLRAAHGRVQ